MISCHALLKNTNTVSFETMTFIVQRGWAIEVEDVLLIVLQILLYCHAYGAHVIHMLTAYVIYLHWRIHEVVYLAETCIYMPINCVTLFVSADD